jgi:hypothetical protein
MIMTYYGSEIPASCRWYEPGEPVPGGWWRKIELIHPDGRVVTIIYEAEPPDPAELRQVMLKLQKAAATYGLRVMITGQDGATVEAPPISVPARG